MSDTLKYRGYEGSVEYSEEDNALIGRVLGVKDLILYEGESVQELIADFKTAIDDHIEFCKAENENSPIKETA